MSAAHISRALEVSALLRERPGLALELAGQAQVRPVAEGSVLIDRGEPIRYVDFVVAGRFEVVGGAGNRIAEIGFAETIGELTLVDGQPAGAKVRARRDSLVARVPVERLQLALRRDPQLFESLLRVTTDRLRTSVKSPVCLSPRRVVVSGRLTESLEHAAVAVGQPTTRSDELMAEVDSVVLAPETTGATADLLIAEPGQAPTMSAIRTVELDTGLESSQRRLSAAADYRIKLHGAGDGFGRLGRLVFGGARVLVLSGGAWRGGAHIAAHGVLTGAGLEFDAYVGVSAGGCVALGFAAGWPAVRVREACVVFGRGWSPLRDLGPTPQGLTTGRGLTVAAVEAFGRGRVESLETPCILAAASLRHRELRGLARGEGWRLVRASGAIPALTPPVRIDDDVYVDGGLLDNLPVSLARSLFPSPRIMAIDVGTPSDIDVRAFAPDGVVKRRTALRQRDVSAKLLTSLMRGPAVDPDCDVLIQPDVVDLPPLDEATFRKAIERGRVAAEEVLPTLGPEWF